MRLQIKAFFNLNGNNERVLSCAPVRPLCRMRLQPCWAWPGCAVLGGGVWTAVLAHRPVAVARAAGWVVGVPGVGWALGGDGIAELGGWVRPAAVISVIEYCICQQKLNIKIQQPPKMVL